MSSSPGSTSAVLQHPVYATWAPVWWKLLHIYDGSGGFLDGTYLVAHPREWADYTSENPRTPTKKLKARRALARYENVAAVILDQKRAALFREPITRVVGPSDKTTPHPLELWWNDVDGNGCSISDWMADAYVWAALLGHAVHYMDRATTPEDALTAADVGDVFLRMYSALDVPDWLQDDRGELDAIKLLEAVPRTSIHEAATSTSYRERIVDKATWQLRTIGQNKTGTRKRVEDEGEPTPHDFGIVPVVVQYAKGKKLTQFVGQSILGDPMLYIDLYNLTSELREILRAQTFGMLNVPLGTGDTAVSREDAEAMMGGGVKSTDNVLFTPVAAGYIQPDSDNITVYQEERSQLLRTIYRLNAIPWESDSKDAEAQGSLKLKREDMNQILAAYAAECQKTEIAIAKLWFRAKHGEQWERAWDEAKVTITYPQTFDVTPFEVLLEQAQAAMTLEMGPIFMGELKKRLAPKILPELPPDKQAKIEQECIETAEAMAEHNEQKRELEITSMQEPSEPKAA